MKQSGISNWIVVCLMMVPMVVLSAPSISVTNSPNVKMSKLQQSSGGRSSTFKAEFTAWADKQDWFALSDKAEFGDLNRGKCAEKGRTFGYSVEFVDSKGKKHILGIGLAKESVQGEMREMKRNMAAMHAQESIMMHGKSATADASGRKSLSVSGTLRASAVLSETIVRPGTEEKWFLCVFVRHDKFIDTP